MANNKPWLKNKEEKVISVMGAKITIKDLNFGDSRKAVTVATKTNFQAKTAEIDTGLMTTLRALYAIVDWDLTDENDAKLPITLDTLDNVLDESFVSELIQKINENTEELTEKEKK